MNKTGWHVTAVLVLLGVALRGQAQQSKGAKEMERLSGLEKLSSVYDRARGLHNRSNIGIWFENRGKLYPRLFNPATPSGEFPLGSGMEYIWKVNPFVGVPGNVIQGKWGENEEWEAAAGYHNRDSATVATSDMPATWPATGWPVRDASGNPKFVSDQDTYCVYNDSANTKGILCIQVNQTGYAFEVDQFRNMIFFTYQIVNNSSRAYDSLYFGLYTDIDVGSVHQAGASEYTDDKVGFDAMLQLAYFYDDGYTPEWPGNHTGYFGLTVIKTPAVGGSERGMTDFHYNVYEDDVDNDTVQYGIMSSAGSLYTSTLGPQYFHLGANAPDLHFDDPATVPAAGLDIVANLGSGPYVIAPGDTLTFVTAVVAGHTHDEILQSAQSAHDLAEGGYVSVGGRDEASVPHTNTLYQNYPNPFNPSTVIRYSLPRRAHVQLAVSDPLGRTVAVLVDGEQEAGHHEVKLDGADLTTGVYFCRLRAGDYVQTRRMLLLK